MGLVELPPKSRLFTKEYMVFPIRRGDNIIGQPKMVILGNFRCMALGENCLESLNIPCGYGELLMTPLDDNGSV